MISPQQDHGPAAAPLPGNRLDQVFRARAQAFADQVAVSDGRRTMTYAELDAASDRLATRLRGLGVRAGSLVGLYIGRHVAAVAGLLGILKAGGAYLPLDPAYASERTRFILQDSRVEVLVSDAAAAASLGHSACRLLLVEEALAGPRAEPAVADPVAGSGQGLAYVIYTSGSTGQPKGVMVTHHNVIRLFEQTQPWFGFNERDVWCQFHSIGFDFSVWELWGALLHGGRVVIVPHEVARAPDSFRKWVAEQRVTILNQTPSAFRHFEAADRSAGTPLALRHIVFGGEALVPSLLEAWIGRHGDRSPSLVNMYGITETTVHVTHKVLRRDDIVGRTDSPIGRPLPDLGVHLLDEHGRPVADGTAGEVHVTGPGVALGYLHRPDLTQQRFVEIRPAHPSAAPVRAYRSGDIAVRNSEGELFYRGRCDDQIKVRGFRVEPHEVEAVLSQGSHVAACCVLPHDYGDGDVRLVAYVVPASADTAWTDARTDELRRLAAARLPDYMRPSAHVIVDALPLTAHGKLDKQALPAPQSGAWVRAAAPQEPMPGEEAFILSLWRDQLGLRDLGLHDEFFDHGGTSLALIRSLSVLKKHYRVELDTRLLADGATAANLAHAIRTALAPTLHATH